MRLDQPAEGRDHETKHNAAHMLGKSNTTGRDSYLFFGKMARADANQVETSATRRPSFPSNARSLKEYPTSRSARTSRA